jgi:hypothetical protein
VQPEESADQNHREQDRQPELEQFAATAWRFGLVMLVLDSLKIVLYLTGLRHTLPAANQAPP